MSRIGNAPVSVPAGVEIKVNNDVITVKGKKGELSQTLSEGITAKVEEAEIIIERASDSKTHKAQHGLMRALVNNMVVGVSEGFKTEQEFVGVGYRAVAKGQQLEMQLGYSHPIIFELPAEVKVTAETVKGKPPVVTLESYDKQLIGQCAAKIRSLRKPEPYKGKGIRFKGEEIRRKAGKAAAK